MDLEIAHCVGEKKVTFLDLSTADLLRRAAEHEPDRLALIVPPDEMGRDGCSWTYAELLAKSTTVARALLQRFEPGDHIAVWAATSERALFLQLGAALAGIVLVALNPANRSNELRYLLARSAVKGLFLDRVFRGLDNEAVMIGLSEELSNLHTCIYMDQWDEFLLSAQAVELPKVSSDKAALILFTSGSTGQPKAVLLRHEAVVNNAVVAANHLGINERAVWLNVMPMFHVGGAVSMTLACIGTYGTQVLLPQFKPEAMLNAIEKYGATTAMAVPTMLYGLLESPQFKNTDFSSLDLIVTGGSPVPPELLRRVKREMGVEVANLMGQTEASGTMFATRRGDAEDRVVGSVGFPLPLTEVKIVCTEDGHTLRKEEIGEICVLSRCAMKEYYGMPEETGRAIDAGGWLHTGDLGAMREDGYIRVTGRLKDMIIRGGENIYPREIEDSLAEHPAISQSAVFGVKDEKWGEQVAAALILKPGNTVDTDQVAEFLRTRISRHKVPVFWQVKSSLPLNASGKVQKFILQEEFENGRLT